MSWMNALGVGLAIAMSSMAAAQPDIYHVDPDDGEDSINVDGLSWPQAFATLAYALDRSFNSGDQIRVAAGTYKPGSSRSDTFLLDDTDHVGLIVKGGYEGCDGMDCDDAENRDVVGNLTILSGDIDTGGDNDSYHVVTIVGSSIDDNTVLDGFTITLGFDDTSDASGAGLLIGDGQSTGEAEPGISSSFVDEALA